MKNKSNVVYIFIYIIIALSFFKIPFLMIRYNFISKFYFLLQLIWFFLFLFFNIRQKKITRGLALILLFLSYNAIISFGKTPITTILSNFLSTAGMCLVVNNKDENSFYNLTKGFKYALLLLLALNLCTMLAFPNGLYYNSGNNSSQNWLLGYKNGIILYIYPLIVFSHLDTIIFKGKKISKYDILSFTISFITVLKAKSSTSFVGLIIVLISILIPHLLKNTKILNSVNYFYTYITLFFSIVVLKLQNIFSFIIEDLLHKDLTFTGRTYIWDYVLKNLSNNLIFGHGDKQFSYTLSTGTAVKSTHNQILQVIYNYGLISLLIFFLIIFIAMKVLKNNKDNQITKFLSLCIFMWFIMMITESYDMRYFFYLIVFAFNIEDIINICEGGTFNG